MAGLRRSLPLEIQNNSPLHKEEIRQRFQPHQLVSTSLSCLLTILSHSYETNYWSQCGLEPLASLSHNKNTITAITVTIFEWYKQAQ
eukprot:m.171335 g.171335  ORF g.171335 m.171335 type:complete len:87 (-) comp13498_c0_seq3:24-284(-)